MSLNESIVQGADLTRVGELGYAIGHGLYMSPGETAARDGGRDSYGDPAAAGLVVRLHEAIRRLNSSIQSHTLATLRDALLPKLVGGELSATTKTQDCHA